MKEEAVSLERRMHVMEGDFQNELQTILRRIRNRRSGEPTAMERQQILRLQARIRDVRKGNINI